MHLCFRTYVKEDIKGYIKNFGKNEVIKDRVTILLDLFSSHLITILSKLVEGMSATYLKYLFNTLNKSKTDVNKTKYK